MLDTTFLFAGKAIFTATNLAKGTRLTFKVTKPKDFKGSYFGSVMKGSDNEADYSYVGMVDGSLGLRATKGSKFLPGTPEFDGLKFVLDILAGRKVTDKVAIAHAGKCGRCGRTLTVPESIASGIGPECAGRIASDSDTKPVKKGSGGIVPPALPKRMSDSIDRATAKAAARNTPDAAVALAPLSLPLEVSNAIVTEGPVPVIEPVWTSVPCTNRLSLTALAAALTPDADGTVGLFPLAEDEADDNPQTAGCMEAPVETDEARAKRVKADEDSADRADEYYSRILGF